MIVMIVNRARPIQYAYLTAFFLLLSAVQNCEAQDASKPNRNINGPQLLRTLMDNLPGNAKRTKAIPTNFALPPYDSNVVQTGFTGSKSGPPFATVVIVTTDPSDRVFQWYQDKCRDKGWKVRVPTAKLMSQLNKSGKFYMLNADKDNETVKLYCTPHKKPVGTTISITWNRHA